MDINQIIFVDKPAGMTSHDVVDRARNIFHTRRVGHAGTLDPFATGLLILGIGKATKELTPLVGLDKTYLATLKLGETSTTDDPEGEITPFTVSTIPTPAEIRAALHSFVGTHDQVTPLYSAKKVGGKKMYELARKGLGDTVARPIKQVTIHKLDLLDYAYPELKVEIDCTSGTYIRALARDIGEKLGCGAYLTELRRTRIGEYLIENAQTLEALEREHDSL
jgi:tRNA pseudouridine55 synthase